MRELVLVIYFLLFSGIVKAQSFGDSLRTEKGYLIYIRPAWVFQPCSDSTTDVWSAINHQSFIPGTFSYSFGQKPLPSEGFGKKFFLRYYDHLIHTSFQDTVYYVYCKVNLIFSKDTSMNTNLTPCHYTLFYKNSTFGLCCRYFLNAIDSIEPLLREDKITYLMYLRNNNYPLPEWSNCFSSDDKLGYSSH